MKYTGNRVDVGIVSYSSTTVYIYEDEIAGVIGKGGKTIDLIEKRLGITLTFVKEKQEIGYPDRQGIIGRNCGCLQR